MVLFPDSPAPARRKKTSQVRNSDNSKIMIMETWDACRQICREGSWFCLKHGGDALHRRAKCCSWQHHSSAGANIYRPSGLIIVQRKLQRNFNDVKATRLTLAPSPWENPVNGSRSDDITAATLSCVHRLTAEHLMPSSHPQLSGGGHQAGGELGLVSSECFECFFCFRFLFF